MPRRGENIRKRKDKRWEGRYSMMTADGARKICSVYGRSYRETKAKLDAAKQMAKEHADHAGKNAMGMKLSQIMFEQAANEWLKTVALSKKASTYVKYKTLYQKHLADPLRNLSIGGMNSAVLNEKVFIPGKKYSGSLQKSICSVVNSVLKYASATLQIPAICIERQIPASPKKKVEVFSEIEQRRLLCCVYREMDLTKMGVVLCMSTGLRLGELCALKWEDIDFQAKVMHVDRTVQRIAVEGQKSKTALLESVPKTFCSKREIPLSDELIRLLMHFRHSYPYVLNKAKPLEPRTFQNRFKKYLQEAGVKEKNVHVLRHTFATNCVVHGIDVKSLSEILGHSSVQITLNRYVHPTIDTKRKYMNTVSAVYGQILGQAG